MIFPSCCFVGGLEFALSLSSHTLPRKGKSQRNGNSSVPRGKSHTHTQIIIIIIMTATPSNYPSLSQTPTPEDLYELDAMDQWLETQAELADIEAAMQKFFLTKQELRDSNRLHRHHHVYARNMNRAPVLRSKPLGHIAHERRPFVDYKNIKHKSKSANKRTGQNGLFVQDPRKSSFTVLKQH